MTSPLSIFNKPILPCGPVALDVNGESESEGSVDLVSNYLLKFSSL